MEMSKERLQLHFVYCTIFLIFCLILVATDRWTDKGNFTDYLTNVATMVSLVLGLIAIFYSFTANADLSKSLGGIATTANDIKETRWQVTNLLEESKNLNSSGAEAAKAMDLISLEVRQSVLALKDTLSGVSKQTQELHSTVSGLPSRFDDFEQTLEEVKVKNQQGQAITSALDANTLWNDAAIDRLLARPPLSTNFLMLACSLAASSGKKLSIEEVAKLLDRNIPNILTGSFQTLHAAGLFDRAIVGKQVYTISNFNKILASKIESYIVKYIDTALNDEPLDQKQWKESISKIKEAFSAD